MSNHDLAALLGLSVSTIDKKLNGRAPISTWLPLQLGNIDRLIAVSLLPAACPARLAGWIIAGRLR